METLGELYIREGLFPVRFREDALHVAAAVMSEHDFLVS